MTPTPMQYRLYVDLDGEPDPDEVADKIHAFLCNDDSIEGVYSYSGIEVDHGTTARQRDGTTARQRDRARLIACALEEENAQLTALLSEIVNDMTLGLAFDMTELREKAKSLGIEVK